MRMQAFHVSATSTFPPASTATPLGPVKEAPVPMPSENPPATLPANVLTTALGVTLRMRGVNNSETNKTPLASTATPVGRLKEAAVPVPSADSCQGLPLPASVLTTAAPQSAPPPINTPPVGFAVGDTRVEADLDVDEDADTEALPDRERDGEALPEADPEGSGLVDCELDALGERDALPEAGAEGLAVGVVEP